MSDLVPRDEVRSALEARRELGPDYDDQVVDALVDKIERRLEERRPVRHPGAITPIVLGSLGLSIPLIAIAGEYAGLAGVIAVCVAIVLVNVVAMRR